MTKKEGDNFENDVWFLLDQRSDRRPYVSRIIPSTHICCIPVKRWIRQPNLLHLIVLARTIIPIQPAVTIFYFHFFYANPCSFSTVTRYMQAFKWCQALIMIWCSVVFHSAIHEFLLLKVRGEKGSNGWRSSGSWRWGTKDGIIWKKWVWCGRRIKPISVIIFTSVISHNSRGKP